MIIPLSTLLCKSYKKYNIFKIEGFSNHSTITVDQHKHRKNTPDISWNWDQANYTAEWHEPIFSLMSRYIPVNSSVLEVGAGGSHTLGAIAGRLKCSAYGLEPDADGITKTNQLAKPEGTNVEMVGGDGFVLPFRDEIFDVVYSLGLIEHFDPEQSNALILEHKRVCKTGGLVIIAVPNFLNLPHTLRKFVLGGKYEYYPERSYTIKELKKALSTMGMRVIAEDGLLPLWGLRMFSFGWRITALLKRIGLHDKIEHLESPKRRALLGYMTYAIAVK